MYAPNFKIPGSPKNYILSRYLVFVLRSWRDLLLSPSQNRPWNSRDSCVIVAQEPPRYAMAATAKFSTYPSKWLKNQQNPSEIISPTRIFSLFAAIAHYGGLYSCWESQPWNRFSHDFNLRPWYTYFESEVVYFNIFYSVFSMMMKYKQLLQRANYNRLIDFCTTNHPLHGALIVSTILGDFFICILGDLGVMKNILFSMPCNALFVLHQI